ncbi:MAG: transposase family protein [Terriglobales bacterium]
MIFSVTGWRGEARGSGSRPVIRPTLVQQGECSGPRACAHCGSTAVRSRGRDRRVVRHESWGLRHCWLEVEA